MQASLPQDLVPVGSTILLTVVSASCSIFLAIGQAVFQDRLFINISAAVSPDVAKLVESIGATSIRSAISAGDLATVLRAYSNSITQVFVSVHFRTCCQADPLTGTVYPCCGTSDLAGARGFHQMGFHQETRREQAGREGRRLSESLHQYMINEWHCMSDRGAGPMAKVIDKS